MSDVIIGYHRRTRCAWAGSGDTPLVLYHDEVWGKRTFDESTLFAALTLSFGQDCRGRRRDCRRISSGDAKIATESMRGIQTNLRR